MKLKPRRRKRLEGSGGGGGGLTCKGVRRRVPASQRRSTKLRNLTFNVTGAGEEKPHYPQ